MFVERDSRFWKLERFDAEGAGALAARLTFTGTSDDPDSHYYQAPGLSPDETAAAILGRVERVASACLLDADEGNPLGPQDVDEIHRIIFGPLFGERTLRRRAHREDISSYGIVKGGRDDPYETMQAGTGGPHVSRKLRQAFARLELERTELFRAAETREVDLIEAVRPAAKLYARLIGIHPFVDGNGRTGFCVLSHSLVRCGAIAVALPEDGAHSFHWCLGQGMRKDRAPDYDPLAEWIVERIKDSGASE